MYFIEFWLHKWNEKILKQAIPCLHTMNVYNNPLKCWTYLMKNCTIPVTQKQGVHIFYGRAQFKLDYYTNATTAQLYMIFIFFRILDKCLHVHERSMTFRYLVKSIINTCECKMNVIFCWEHLLEHVHELHSLSPIICMKF